MEMAAIKNLLIKANMKNYSCNWVTMFGTRKVAYPVICHIILEASRVISGGLQ